MAAKSEESAMLSNLWQNLTDLSVNDPEAYNKIAVESAKQFQKSLRPPPLPFLCIRAFAALNEESIGCVIMFSCSI